MTLEHGLQRWETLDECIQTAVNLVQAGDAVDWTLADCVAWAHEHYGKAGLNAIASNVGFGLRWAQEQSRVAKAIPQPLRAEYPELRWATFKAAASTDNPEFWLALAAEHGWSSRELRTHIRGEKPVTDRVKKLLVQVEKMLNSEGGDALEDGLLELLRRRG